MNKWIAEFELEDGDTMPEHMDLNYMGAKIDFHCRPMWIPVSERLPEDETDVLVCNKDGEIELTSGSRSTEVDDFIWYTSGWRFGNVVAWMPLPAPYEPQESEEEDDGRYGI
jgi:hypothetical protein